MDELSDWMKEKYDMKTKIVINIFKIKQIMFISAKETSEKNSTKR